MKKSLFAIACILAVVACKQSSTKEPVEDSTIASEVQKMALEEPVSAEEVRHEYLSQDLATFELYGRVQSVTYTQEHSFPITVQFNDTGNVTAIVRVVSEEEKENAEVQYNDANRIEYIRFESDSPWVTILGYEEGDGFRAPRTYTSSNQVGNYIEETYHRDSKGLVTNVEVQEVVHFGTVENDEAVSIEFSDFDKKGNWLKCTIKHGDTAFVKVRAITYFP